MELVSQRPFSEAWKRQIAEPGQVGGQRVVNQFARRHALRRYRNIHLKTGGIRQQCGACRHRYQKQFEPIHDYQSFSTRG